MSQQSLLHFSLGSSHRLPLILQTEAAECGLACLAMISGYYGAHTQLNELRQRCSLSIEGCTLLDLMQFAERLNLSGRPLRIELDELSAVKTPCILHWDLNHFVVLKAVEGDRCVVMDPAFGEKRMSMPEVSKHFTGVVLELTPTTDFSQKKPGESLGLSDFWQNISGLKRSLLLLLTLSVMLQVFTLVAPYYMQLVVDDVLLSADQHLLVLLALGFGLVLLFEITTSTVRSFVLLHFGNSLNLQMAGNLFQHLIRLPLNYFEKRHVGDVMSRFGSLAQVRELLTTGFIEALIDGLMAVAILAVILVYSPELTGIVLIAVLLYAGFRLALYRQVRRLSEQEILARSKEQSNFIETLRAMQTIKLFGAESKRQSQWQHLNVAAINKELQLGLFTISHQTCHRLLFGLENILVIYFGAKLVLAGGFSTGMLFAFVAYKSQFMDRMARLIEKALQFKMLNLHFDRLADIALTQKEQLHSVQPMTHDLQGGLQIRNLSFAYSDASPAILKNIQLEIAPGESVALVGPSGCGKTTLMKLMLGLLQPQQGEILIDGIPLLQMGLACYRQQVAAVMQDDQLLSGSIKENIAFFSEQVDMERLIACARLAAIDDDIMKMPMGYHSLVGDMGSALSGGQKQRILLARALYRQPRILFLDEATSHLDTKTESYVSQAIKELNITRVVIAHRPETIASVDRVIELK